METIGERGPVEVAGQAAIEVSLLGIFLCVVVDPVNKKAPRIYQGASKA